MARDLIILRDEQGTEHEIEVKPDGFVRIGTGTLSVILGHRGQARVGDRLAWAAADGPLRWVYLDGRVYTFEVRQSGAREPRPKRRDGGLSAPMPATVVSVAVSPGDTVRAGDTVVILEAMKMELPVRASADGVVASVRCRAGELVQPGQDLIEITSTPDSRLPTPNQVADDK